MKSLKKILFFIPALLMLCFWACTSTDLQGDQYLKFNLSESLKNYNKVQIRLVSANDSNVVYDTVWNDTLKDPVNFPRYKLKAAKNKDFLIQIRGYNKDKLSWAKDIKIIGSAPQAPVTVQSDVRLYHLDLSKGILEPALDPEVYAYTVNLPNDINSLSFTLSALDTANILLFGQLQVGWDKVLTQPLVTGNNIFVFTVQNKDGKVSKSYTVTVNRGGTVPLTDTTNVTSLIINPKTVTLYKGDSAASLGATVLPIGTTLQWISLNDAIAKVDVAGKVTGLVAGKTQIVVKTGKKADTCEVTVIVDMPTVSVGNNIAVKQNTEVSFPISITQSHGTIAAFKYDLEGDGTWDNSDSLSGTIPASLAHTYSTLKIYTANFYVRDSEGNFVNTTRTITVSDASFLIAIVSPSKDTLVNKSPITLLYTVNGTTLSKQFDLKEGGNILLVSAGTGVDSAAATLKVTLDTRAPVVKITSPKDSTYLNLNTADITWTVDGVAQTVQLKADLGTTDGLKNITREFTDAAGNVGSNTIRIYRKTTLPMVAITAPADGFTTNQTSINVAWTVDGVIQSAQTTEPLVEGLNTIIRKFVDAAGNEGAKSIKVTRITTGPVVKINSPSDGLVTNQTSIIVDWSVDGIKQKGDTSATLTDGINIIKRSATDKAGNKSVDSVAVTLNTKVPNVQITSPIPGAITNQTSINVNWTVNGVAQPASSEPLTIEGGNTIIRKFKDVAGNEGIASIQITRDTKAPVVAILSPLTNSLTNASKIKVVWTVDGEVQAQNDSESITTDGPITIKRQFTDAATNQGTYSVTINRDATKPNAPILSTAIALTNGDAVWTWTDGGGDAGSGLKPNTFQYQLNAGTVTSINTNSLIILKNNLSDSTYTLVVQQQDLAGNWSANSNPVIITSDKTPPSQTIIAGTRPTNTFPKWTWSSNGGISEFQYKLNSSDFSTGATPLKNIFEYVLPELPASGVTNTLWVQEKDAAGNWSNPNSYAIKYDVSQPTVTIASPKSAGTYIDTLPSIILSGSVSGQNAISKVAYSMGSTPITANLVGSNWSTGSIALTNGVPVTVTVIATDAANNTGASVLTLLRDTSKPNAPTLTALKTPTNGTATWNWTSNGDVSGGGGLRSPAVYRCFLDGSTTPQTPTGTSFTQASGTHTLSVQEQDFAGNWSANSASVQIVVDNTAPQLAITGPAAEGRVTAINPTVTGTVSDANGIKSLSYTIAEGNKSGTITVGSTWTIPNTTNYGEGTNTLTITAIDNANNSISQQIVITKRKDVVFVRAGKSGDGTSWQNAYGNIDIAMSSSRATVSGAQVWVSAGTYIAAQTVVLPINGALLGGFPAGNNATDTAGRDVSANKTVLTGAGLLTPTTGNLSFVDGFFVQSSAFTYKYDTQTGSSKLLRFSRCIFDAFRMQYQPVGIIGADLEFISCQFTNCSNPLYLQTTGHIYILNCIFTLNDKSSTLITINSSTEVLVKNSQLLDNMGQNFQMEIYNTPTATIDGTQIVGGKNALIVGADIFIYTNSTP